MSCKRSKAVSLAWARVPLSISRLSYSYHTLLFVVLALLGSYDLLSGRIDDGVD